MPRTVTVEDVCLRQEHCLLLQPEPPDRTKVPSTETAKFWASQSKPCLAAGSIPTLAKICCMSRSGRSSKDRPWQQGQQIWVEIDDLTLIIQDQIGARLIEISHVAESCSRYC